MRSCLATYGKGLQGQGAVSCLTCCTYVGGFFFLNTDFGWLFFILMHGWEYVKQMWTHRGTAFEMPQQNRKKWSMLYSWPALLELSDQSNRLEKSHPVLRMESCFNYQEQSKMQRRFLSHIWRIAFCIFHTPKVCCISTLQHLYWRCSNPCNTM